MLTRGNNTYIAAILEDFIASGADPSKAEQIVEIIDNDQDANLDMFSSLRPFLKGRSSEATTSILRLIKILLCRSVSFIRFYPTYGEKLQKTIFNIAVKKVNLLNLKLKVPKKQLAAEFTASQIIWGLDLLYKGTQYSAKYSSIKGSLCFKNPSYSPINEEIRCFEEANSLALSIFNGNDKAPTSFQSNVAPYNAPNTYSPTAYAPTPTLNIQTIEESVKLLISFFNANPNLCGRELEENEIPSIVFNDLDEQQQILRGLIQKEPNSPSTNLYVQFDNSITALKSTYYSLINKPSFQQAPATGFNAQSPSGNMMFNAMGGQNTQIPYNQNAYPSTPAMPAGNAPKGLQSQDGPKDIFSVLEDVNWNLSNVKNNEGKAANEVGPSNNKFGGFGNSNKDPFSNLSSVENYNKRNSMMSSGASQSSERVNNFGAGEQNDIFSSNVKGPLNGNGKKEGGNKEDDIFFGF